MTLLQASTHIQPDHDIIAAIRLRGKTLLDGTNQVLR
jgi:hypothetical protein